MISTARQIEQVDNVWPTSPEAASAHHSMDDHEQLPKVTEKFPQ
jgi:hypothetical protein